MKEITFSEKVLDHLDTLIERYPSLSVCRESILEAVKLMVGCYMCDGKIMIAGNGGSAADADHFQSQLMKKYRVKRPLKEEFVNRLVSTDPERGEVLAKSLETPLAAINLTTHEALNTAYNNDVAYDTLFAQQLFGFGCPGDIFVGISTSGNSRNVMYASVVARAKGIKTIGLTGSKGGKLAEVADVCIKVPEDDGFKIQELHLPVYNTICVMLEEYFFGE
ncbi:MAG: SIS domain-containing protein [Erysipelotrichaceae bacterium]|nr:SIS domain-containing protein [Erysipelotrichaceae bacterium]